MSHSHIFMELSPDKFLSMIGELEDFDRGGRIRVYRLCRLYTEMFQ